MHSFSHFSSVIFTLIVFYSPPNILCQGVEDFGERAEFEAFMEVFENSQDYWEIDSIFQNGIDSRNPNFLAIEKKFRRWSWFIRPRIGQNGSLQDVREKMAQTPELRVGSLNVASSCDTLDDWHPIGPFFKPTEVTNAISGLGRINQVRANPAMQGNWMAASPAGGVWMTTDSGGNWELILPKSDDFHQYGFSDVAFSQDFLFAASGDADGFDETAQGIFRSSDNGESWQLVLELEPGDHASRIVVDESANKVVCAGLFGIAVSEDMGDTWILPSETAGIRFRDVEIHPGNNEILYASTQRRFFNEMPAGIWKSENGGITWVALDLPAEMAGQSRIEIAVTPGNPSMLYALVAQFYAFHCFAISFNEGDTWDVVADSENSPNLMAYGSNGGGPPGQAWYDLALDVHPTIDSLIYVGGINVWKSDSRGQNWTAQSMWTPTPGFDRIHADIHGLSFTENGDLLTAHDGGVAHSIQGGEFFDASGGLAIGQIYHLAIAQDDSLALSAGFQDGGTNCSLPGDTTWQFILGGDGFSSHVAEGTDYENRLFYASTQNGAIYRKWANESYFEQIVSSNLIGDTTVDRKSNWDTPMFFSQNDSTLFVAKSDLFFSNDYGSTWLPLEVPETEGQELDLDFLAVHEANHNVWITGRNLIGGGAVIYLTQNGGATIQTDTLPNEVGNIQIDPTDYNHLVYCSSQFWSVDPHVLESFDFGENWQQLGDEAFLGVTCSSIEIRGAYPGEIYLGTDEGIFVCRDGNWVAFSQGLPQIEITDIAIHESSGQVVAATYGRGIWARSILPSDYFPICEDEEACNYGEANISPFGCCIFQDECGICDGQGAVYECGCFDIPEGDCDCNGSQLDAIGNCGGDCPEDADGDGVCDDEDDCVGYFDVCGVCNGDGDIYDCGCFDFPTGFCDCEGLMLDTDGDGICDVDEIAGCNDEDACNYDPLVSESDDSCVFFYSFTIYQSAPASDQVVAGEVVSVFVNPQSNVTYTCYARDPLLNTIFGPVEGEVWDIVFPEIAGTGRIYVEGAHDVGGDCVYVPQRTITVTLPPPVGLDERSPLATDLQFFSIPVKHNLTVQLTGLPATSASSWSLRVLNLAGQTVALLPAEPTVTLPVAHYAEGMYFLRLEGPTGATTRRFVVAGPQ